MKGDSSMSLSSLRDCPADFEDEDHRFAVPDRF